MDRTRAPYRFTFVEKLTFLLLQMLFNLALLAVAMANLIATSTVKYLSFVRLAPRYLKAFNSSSCWLFMLIFVAVFSPPLTLTLLFSLLTSMRYACELFDSLPVSPCSSLLHHPIRTMSAFVCPLIEIEDCKLCNISLMMLTKYRLNRTRKRVGNFGRHQPLS